MNDLENLLYKPELQPDRSYRSDAIIDDQPITTTTTTTTDTIVPDRIVQLLEDLLEVKEVAKLLPGDLPTIMDGPLDPLIEQIHVMFPSGTSDGIFDTPITDIYDPDVDEQLPDIIPSIDSIDDYTYVDTELPSLFPINTDIKINIVVPKSLADIAKDTYNHDTIDLKEDYLKKLQTVIQKYLQEMIMVMTETGVSKIEDLTKPYDGSAVVIPNKNMQHLGDFIVRSQIGREQKTRLFRKTHNIDQTMMHMRAWYAAEKQRERYYAEKYGDSENYLNSQSNSILRESRAQYDKKYNQNLYDMYKYLNASVMIVDDTLNMSLKESQAKGALLKSGVNIYATKESLEMAAADKKKAEEASTAKTPVAATQDKSNTELSAVLAKGMLKDTATNTAKEAVNNLTKQADNALKNFGKKLFK